MVFDPETSKLQAQLVDEKAQKETKMVDLSVIKKGLNFHGTAQKDLENEKAEIKKEEEKMERENAMMSKSKTKKDDESEKAQTQESQQAEQEDEREGTLKMI